MHFILTGIVIAVYLLHQDFWFWTTARPFVLGFMPVGLFYHSVYCFLCSALMIFLVKFAWPVPCDDATSALPSEDEGR